MKNIRIAKPKMLKIVGFGKKQIKEGKVDTVLFKIVKK